MRTSPASINNNPPAIDAAVKKPPGLPRRIGARLLHEAREALPPTIFFFVGFNFIVFTTNLLLAEYAVAVSNFMLATIAALVVGKAVLVANAMPYLRRYASSSSPSEGSSPIRSQRSCAAAHVRC
jgi:hypothetical protein